jgi:hypothetical protein
MLLHLEFTLNFSTIFLGSSNIRASREALPTEVKSPEIVIENAIRPGQLNNTIQLLCRFEGSYAICFNCSKKLLFFILAGRLKVEKKTFETPNMVFKPYLVLKEPNPDKLSRS